MAILQGARITGSVTVTQFIKAASFSGSLTASNLYVRGNVGIGTTSPAGTYGKLTVAGGIRTLDDNNSKLELGRYSAGASNSYIKLGTNSNALHFTNAADNADIFTILNGGNVGIGTTSPTRKLHIDGGATTTVGIYIDANGISGTDIEQSSDAFRFQIRDNIPALFYTNNTERIRIASDGNVGIGTSSPVSKLHLDDATAPYITITRTGVPTWQLRNNFPVNQYGFSFNNTTAGTTPLFIGAGGNIGIGTSGPTNRLDVVGGSGTTFNMSNDSDSLRGGKLTFISSSATGRQFYVGTTSAIYNLVFGIDSVEKARIDTAGNVGIGTTSPSGILDIQSSNSGDQLVRNWNTNTSGTGKSILRIANSGNNAQGTQLQFTDLNYYVGTISSDRTNGMAFYVGQQATPLVSERMRIDISGNVGIGTTAPSYKFQVNGDQFGTSLKGGDLGAGSEVVRMIKYDNTYAMVVRGDGYVGIGTSSPSNKITIEADTSGAAFADNNVGQLVIRGATNTAKRLGLGIDTTNNIGVIQAQLYGTGNYPLVLNPAGGNVGIGTSSPGAKLDVNGEVYISPNTAGKNTFALSTNASNDARLLMKSDTTTKVDIQANGTSYFNGGNVGIGTTSPFGTAANRTVLSINGTTDVSLNIGSGGSQRAYLYGVSTYAELGTIGSLPLTFAPNNTEKMRLNVDGNLGIGTTSPANKLHVIVPGGSYNVSVTNQSKLTGSVIIQADNSGANSRASLIMRGADSIGGAISVAREDTSATWRTYMAFYTNYVTGVSVTDIQEKMRLNADGNLGIGTTSPASLLHVGGQATAATATPTAIQMDNSFRNATGGNTSLKFYLYKNGGESYGFGLNNAGGIEYHAGNSGGTGANHAFYTETTEKMRITSGGNVGIGTTSPANLLHVAGTIRTSYFSTFYGMGETGLGLLATYGSFNQSITFASSNTNNRFRFYFDAYTSDLYVQNSTDAGSTINTRLFIKSDGNVGIGTTTTGEKITISGNALVFGDTGAVGTGTAYYLGDGANSRDIALTRVGTAALAIGRYYPSAWAETIRFTADGNVGIGSSSPSYKLHVNGTSGFEDTLNITVDQRIQTYPASTGGYGMGLTLWSANTSGVSEAYGRPGFIGRNLSWNGSNFIAATTNSGNNWGVVAGTMFTNNDVRFLTRAASENGLNYSLGTNIDSITRMLINTSGNVGIGTTSPVNKLHVSGSSTNLPLKLEGLTSNATGYFLTVDNTTGVVYKSTSGANGTSGTSGANGSPGTSGSSGASGAAGTSGSSGANGGTGSSGSSGTTSIKAWVHFDGTGTSGTSGIAPNASNNVSSITDNGTGDYTINFTSAFANAFYVVSGTVTYDYENPGQSINNTFIAVPRRPTAQAAGSCRIVTFALDNVLYDCKYVRVSFSN